MSKDLKDAIDYFEEMGFIEELTSDKRHYVETLIAHAKKSEEKPKSISIAFSLEDLEDLQSAEQTREGQFTQVFSWEYEGIAVYIGTGEECPDESK